MKDISIIVPHYNTLDLLKKLIRSIPVDTSLELIVVDDKSELPVEDEAEVKRLLEKREGIFLKNTTDEKNAGVCRNIGMKQATGKWLLFADADDFFVEGAFDVLKKHLNSDADIIYFPTTSVYLGTNEISDRHLGDAKLVLNYLEDNSHSNELNLRYKFRIPVSKLIRRQLVSENNIWFDSVMVANDVMFSTKVAYKANKVAADENVIYCMTKAPETLTTKKDPKLLNLRVDVFLDRYKFLQNSLEKEDFEMLNLSGKSHLGKALFDGYDISTLWEIYRKFKENNIRVFSIKEIIFDMKRFVYMMSVKKKDIKNNMS